MEVIMDSGHITAIMVDGDRVVLDHPITIGADDRLLLDRGVLKVQTLALSGWIDKATATIPARTNRPPT